MKKKFEKKYKIVVNMHVIHRYLTLFVAQQYFKPEDLPHPRYFYSIYKLYIMLLIKTNYLQFNYWFFSNIVE